MEESKPIKALVVDDAAFMRKQLVELLSDSGEIEVVAVARHGLEALEAIKSLKPDVITLDVDMPVMDGLTTIKHIMVKNPVPVVMVSGLADQGKITFEALRLGAIDFFPKPSGTISKDLKEKSDELIKTLRLAAKANPRVIKRAVSMARRGKTSISSPGNPKGMVLVLARQGAVSTFIRMLPVMDDLNGVGFACVQDLSASVLVAYSKELNASCRCVPFDGNRLLLKSDQCVLISESCLPAVKKVPKGFCFEPSKADLDISEFIVGMSETFGANLCLVVLGGQVPRNVSFVQEVMSRGGELIALDPSKCACSDLPDFILKETKGQIAACELDLWEHIKGFSRRLYIQNARRDLKQVKSQ